MRRIAPGLALAGVLCVLLGVAPGRASAHGWGHRYGGWGWGPRVIVAPGWGWGGYWGPRSYAYPCPPAYGYGYPLIGREAPTPLYIERPSPPVEGYWYYCESAGAYYPRVPSCPEPWVKVPPVPE